MHALADHRRETRDALTQRLSDEFTTFPRDAVHRCVADVQAAQITCAEPNTLAEGANATRIIGGQDLYVKLTSEGTAHDPESGIFRSEVRVQNLTGETLGTADGDSIDGVRVFFHEGPTATGGSGPVEVENADGEDVFTESAQPYFLYPEILSPMEGTQPREWRFLLGPEVTSFSFMVYVAAEVLEEDAILIDSTSMSIDEVLEAVHAEALRRNLLD